MHLAQLRVDLVCGSTRCAAKFWLCSRPETATPPALRPWPCSSLASRNTWMASIDVGMLAPRPRASSRSSPASWRRRRRASFPWAAHGRRRRTAQPRALVRRRSSRRSAYSGGGPGASPEVLQPRQLLPRRSRRVVDEVARVGRGDHLGAEVVELLHGVVSKRRCPDPDTTAVVASRPRCGWRACPRRSRRRRSRWPRCAHRGCRRRPAPPVRILVTRLARRYWPNR